MTGYWVHNSDCQVRRAVCKCLSDPGKLMKKEVDKVNAYNAEHHTVYSYNI